jgi:hypothetical protein
VDTVDHGQAGRPEAGDELVFTFVGPVDPNMVLAGWDGSATPVTVHIEGPGRNDVLTIHSAADNSPLTELGAVLTNRDYVTAVDFVGSQMTLSGDTITIVLGTPSGTVYRDPSARELLWTTPRGAASESGHPDSDF